MMHTFLDYTVAAEDYETRVARGDLKGEAMRSAMGALSRLAAIARRQPQYTVASVPEWARDTVAAVCEFHGVDISQLLGRRRHRSIARARNEAAFRLREMGRSFPEIGRALGGRDHSTIMHAVASYETNRMAVTAGHKEAA